MTDLIVAFIAGMMAGGLIMLVILACIIVGGE